MASIWHDIAHCGGAILRFLDVHGSGIAAIAAILGIPFLFWQIFQSEWQERRRLSARRRAALATLPITLTAINDWAEEAARSQAHVYDMAKGRSNGGSPAPIYVPPPSPQPFVEGIERMIEAAPKDKVGRILAAILAEVQVLSSRLSDEKEFSPANIRGQMFSIDDNLLRAAQVSALASSLYGEARRLVDDVPVSWDEVKTALNLMEVREDQFRDVHGLLSRAVAKDLASRMPLHQKAWGHLRALFKSRSQ